MRFLPSIVMSAALATSAAAQLYAPPPGCADGHCPVIISPPSVVVSPRGAPLQSPLFDTRSVVRVINAYGSGRSLGSGTLVDTGDERGLVITCAHLFREGTGRVTVAFPEGRTFEGQLLKTDTSADLAVLAVRDPGVKPIVISQNFPQRGDALVSCGYGSDGQLWCNRGQAIGYVTMVGSHANETLELGGAARLGDSGGPVFNSDGHLVAVLFGTNGQVVDATHCGRVRRFLADVCPRFRARQQPPKAEPSPKPAPPLVQAPAPNADPAVPDASPALAEQIGKLERLVSAIHLAWQAASAKLDATVAAAEKARQAAEAARGNSPLTPPEVTLPPGADSIRPGADAIAEAARPWLSARLAALLISLGIPGGIAGVAAGGIVYVVMRRARRRLQAQVNRLKRGSPVATSDATASADELTEPVVVQRHHNQYVPYELTTLDKAWAAAHAHVGEKYPGAIPYLKMVEGVKDQLLSGSKSSELS